MVVRGERVDTLGRPRPAPGRPRYCRLCGGPLGVSLSAMSGVRCLNCGAPSGTPARAAATRPRDFVLPRADTPIAIVPAASPPPASATTARIERLRAWVAELMREESRPSARAIITAAAAGMAIIVAITVSITLS